MEESRTKAVRRTPFDLIPILLPLFFFALHLHRLVYADVARPRVPIVRRCLELQGVVRESKAGPRGTNMLAQRAWADAFLGTPLALSSSFFAASSTFAVPRRLELNRLRTIGKRRAVKQRRKRAGLFQVG